MNGSGSSSTVLRTPDRCFAGLSEYPFRPCYQYWRGLRMHFIDEGHGAPVLLLHGEPTWSYMYRSLIPPLVEAGFAWLDAHWPATEGETVLSWGDARIGNVLYDGFTPAAVLDWEMATLGPRELDLGWLIYAHRIFDDIAGAFGLPGMPGFMRADDVAARYEELTDHRLGDLAFYGTLAALQYAIVFLRTGARSVHFGEVERPEDVEALFHHKPLMEKLMAKAGIEVTAS